MKKVYIQPQFELVKVEESDKVFYAPSKINASIAIANISVPSSTSGTSW